MAAANPACFLLGPGRGAPSEFDVGDLPPLGLGNFPQDALHFE
jgi:hypothetical protein